MGTSFESTGTDAGYPTRGKTLNLEDGRNAGLLRPFWGRLGIAPWGLFLLAFAVLAAARFYSAFGPPQFRALFLLQVLAMWALPWISAGTGPAAGWPFQAAQMAPGSGAERNGWEYSRIAEFRSGGPCLMTCLTIRSHRPEEPAAGADARPYALGLILLATGVPAII